MTTKPNQTAESEPKPGNGLCRELDTLRSRVEELESRLAVAAESIQFWPDSAYYTAQLANALKCRLPKVVFESWWRHARVECDQLRSRVAELEANEQTTLRDQLAMAALQGLVSTLQYHPDCGLPCHQGALTDDAYKIADAALKARNQPPAESK